jgi:hypothetical protein
MTELPTRDAFAGCLGQPFRIPVGPSDFVELSLIEVTAPRPGSGSGDRPFALVFRGPHTPVLPQKLYPMENERLGLHEIFIVPIGPDPAGMRYEAVFN